MSWRKRALIAGSALVATSGAVAALAPAAHAAGTTITVTTTGDAPVLLPLQPVECTVPSGGTQSCLTLRAAIAQADSDNANDTIVLGPSTYNLTDCADGALPVTASMTITGAGSGSTLIFGATCTATARAQGPGARAVVGTPWDDSLIYTDCHSLVLDISGVTMTNGNANTSSGAIASGNGGAIDMNDGCFDTQSLTLSDVDLSHNNAANAGGGLWLDDTNGGVSLTGVTLDTNTAANGNGGGAYIDTTGAIAINGVNAHDNQMTCVDCTHSVGFGGGAMYISSGAVAPSLSNGEFTTNTANGWSGGALYLLHGTWDISAVTFDSNSAGGNGGGIYFSSATARGTVTNMTAVGNSANQGGAVALGVSVQALSIVDSTIDGNNAGIGGAFWADSGSTSFHGDLLHNNTTDGGLNECFTTGSTTATSSTGFNLSDDTSCALTLTSDTQNAAADPLLQPLGTNSAGTGIPPLVGAAADRSPLKTQALGSGSPALNVIPGSACPPPATDERGVTRPQGPACEIGAYEVIAATPSPSPTPTPTAVTPGVPNTGAPDRGGSPLPLVLLAAGAALLAAGATGRLRRLS